MAMLPRGSVTRPSTRTAPPRPKGTGIKQLRENITEFKLSYEIMQLRENITEFKLPYEIMDDAVQVLLKSKIMDDIHK